MHDAFKQLQVEYIDALRPVIADTIMRSPAQSRRLARTVLEAVGGAG